MSNAPHLLRGGRSGWKLGDATLVDHLLHDGLTCAVEGWPMGMAAERTADCVGLSRADLDAFALESQRRAVAAQKAGAFDAEIVPVTITSRKGDATISADEGPRAETTAEALAKLSPAFTSEGIVTAGNASTLSDGAAMLVVSSEERARDLGARPIARVVATAVSGLDPRDLFLAPIGAVRSRHWPRPDSPPIRSTFSRSTRPSPPRCSAACAAWSWTPQGQRPRRRDRPGPSRSAPAAPASW